MLTQPETETALREMAADLAASVREQMTQTGATVPSMALVTTPDSIVVLTVLDVTQRLSMFKEAVESLAATGLVFVHDGWVTLGDGRRADAVLVLFASKWGTADGFAHLYEHTPHGIRFGEIIRATDQHLEPYLRVFVP